MNFLDAYLDRRVGRVVVGGQCSDDMELANMVFQGTVLGPPLWNLFFADVALPAQSTGGEEALFADDLSVFQKFDRFLPVADVKAKLSECKEQVYKWGTTNRVSFDEQKEHLVVLHPIYGDGDHFKLLGLFLDVKLTMRVAIDDIMSRVHPRVTALLRTRGHYGATDLLTQFKIHIWGIMECHSGGIFHACTSSLDRLDRCQKHFVEEIGLAESVAFIDYNFAPPVLRRNIGILGMLHKRVLGQCHPDFDTLLPWFVQRFGYTIQGKHDKQLYNHRLEVQLQHGLFQRSIFAVVDFYNDLPQQIVDCPSVNSFQKQLTKIARERCQVNNPSWMYTFDSRDRSVDVIAVPSA